MVIDCVHVFRDVMGFPIVECTEDGLFTLSKPEGTGGLISTGSVAEQVQSPLFHPTILFYPCTGAETAY